MTFITRKEHPVKKQIVFYLHECKLPELFKDNGTGKINILVKWMSTVFPAVFGIELINLELIKALDKE